jgi:predicted transcriptional regulator
MATSFKKWRTEVMNITQVKAAEILGLSVSQVKNLDSGVERGRKTLIEPSIPILKLMSAAAKGYQFEPWENKNR